MIKHTIAVASGIVVILGSLVAASTYQSITSEEQTAKQESITKQSALAEQSKIKTAITAAVKYQCYLDILTYNKLPVTIQAKVPAPICTVK